MVKISRKCEKNFRNFRKKSILVQIFRFYENVKNLWININIIWNYENFKETRKQWWTYRNIRKCKLWSGNFVLVSMCKFMIIYKNFDEIIKILMKWEKSMNSTYDWWINIHLRKKCYLVHKLRFWCNINSLCKNIKLLIECWTFWRNVKNWWIYRSFSYI